VVVATKVDLLGGIPDGKAAMERLEVLCEKRGTPFTSISSVTGDGVDELIAMLASELKKRKSLKAQRDSRHREDRAPLAPGGEV
jgi:hypothetical protein